MTGGGHAWAVVLAAGEGSRLREVTLRATGEPVPKQFCALRGPKTLLRLALDRAERFAPRERVVAVVAEQHRRWWERELSALPRGNVVAQPRNRGTAAGILLALLEVAARDAAATVVFLPSDHWVEQERVLDLALRRAAHLTGETPHEVVLLGFRTREPDPEYGWIVPEAGRVRARRKVRRFQEKPDAVTAARLLASGALVNGFIFAARASTLLAVFERSAPALVDAFRHVRGTEGRRLAAEPLRELYEDLPGLDFSRDILERTPDRLAVLPVPACGWTDLGTPERLRRCLDGPRSTRRGRPSRPENARPVEPEVVLGLG